jgi:hypothetical protein
VTELAGDDNARQYGHLEWRMEELKRFYGSEGDGRTADDVCGVRFRDSCSKRSTLYMESLLGHQVGVRLLERLLMTKVVCVFRLL